ncbi:ABC transporter G family member 21 [Strongylocentrotus purpuratus]|uniref:ABC transporter domain-containing protein n=1 Tax=Strongylocentrotus purpuratus TaxID=7668 RepID=A0A7M7NVW0_STRPU|nr:ABC transporter G family member 21 [Strongylocentrotus purpuratus]
MASYQKQVTLEFTDLFLTINKREVLRGVSGTAKPGQLMAVMGPSGAGKTLLLTCLAGRQRALESGGIFLNGQPISKRLRRQISFVLQEDLFLSELTLRETFKFTADLRLPSRLTDEDKKQKIRSIVETLDLHKCLDTKMGNSLNRGLSGGEKKRANIGCELLTDPSILLLDEPTSGLDSRTAYELIKTLKEYAVSSGKTVITSIHQPSSRVFQLFDCLLLLSEGQVVYSGDADQVVDYFARLGIQCPPHYNPADYILDIVKGTEEERVKIHTAAKAQSWNHHNCGEHTPNCMHKTFESMAENEMREPRGSINRALSVRSLQDGSFDNSVFVDCVIGEADDQVRSPSAGHMTTNSSHTNGNSSHNNCVMPSLNTSICRDLQAKTTKESQKFHADPYANADKWPTGYFHQLLTLTHRNFKQNRYLVLSKLEISKQLMLALIAGTLWFQVTFAEENIRDMSGLIFFMSAHWGFEPIYSSLTSFQLERAVLAKERAAGAYRLSAYFMSKVIGVLPLLSTMTIVSVTITFWMAGLHKSVLVYFCYVATLLLYVQAGQAIGRFFSAACSNIQQALTVTSLFMLTSMLLGGFFVQNLPIFLFWLRYISYTSYVYRALLSTVFVVVPRTISCNTTVISEFGDCLSLSRADDISTSMSAISDAIVSNSTSITSTRGILNEAQVVEVLLDFSFPIWGSYMVLFGFAVTFNFLAYLVLRFRRPEL